MGSFGGFYKGDKKKPKQTGKGKGGPLNPSVFVMPELISKKKKDY